MVRESVSEHQAYNKNNTLTLAWFDCQASSKAR
jgi:hypothetical protein